MTDPTTEEIAAEAARRIESAFRDRAPPAEITDSKQLSDVEYAEVMAFDGLKPEDVTVELLERAADAVFWFSPEAFCYYLPGALMASLRAGDADSNFFDAIIGCLDRSPEPAYWDEFFAPRFTRLAPDEIDAVAMWTLWLEALHPDWYQPGTYERAQTTLRLLKEAALTRAAAPPS